MSDLIGKTVKVDTRWRHHNGCEYTVKSLANVTSTRPEYPVTVVYQGDNGLIWTKRLEDFLAKMTPIPTKETVAVKCSQLGLSSNFIKSMVEFVEEFDDSTFGELNVHNPEGIQLSPSLVLASRMLTVSINRYSPFEFLELYLLKSLDTIISNWRDYVTLSSKSRIMVIAPDEFNDLRQEDSGGFPVTYMSKLDWFSYTEINTPDKAIELSARIRPTLTAGDKEYASVIIVGIADRFVQTLLGYLSSDLVEFSNAGTGATLFLNVTRGYRA